MSEKIQWAVNHMPKSDDAHLGIMSLDNVKKARAFHKSFPQYTVTPLARLDGQAARLGLGNLRVEGLILGGRPYEPQRQGVVAAVTRGMLARGGR